MRCLANLGSWRELKLQVQHYQSIVGANNLAQINGAMHGSSLNTYPQPYSNPPSPNVTPNVTPTNSSSMLLLGPSVTPSAPTGQQRNNLLVGGGSRLPLAQMSSLISNASSSNVPTATQSAFNRGQMFLQPPILHAQRGGMTKSLRESATSSTNASSSSLSPQSDASVVALFLTNAAFNLGQFELLPGYIVDLEENSVKRCDSLFFVSFIYFFTDIVCAFFVIFLFIFDDLCVYLCYFHECVLVLCSDSLDCSTRQ
jgi:hypothetical protein